MMNEMEISKIFVDCKSTMDFARAIERAAYERAADVCSDLATAFGSRVFAAAIRAMIVEGAKP